MVIIGVSRDDNDIKLLEILIVRSAFFYRCGKEMWLGKLLHNYLVIREFLMVSEEMVMRVWGK